MTSYDAVGAGWGYPLPEGPPPSELHIATAVLRAGRSYASDHDQWQSLMNLYIDGLGRGLSLETLMTRAAWLEILWLGNADCTVRVIAGCNVTLVVDNGHYASQDEWV